MERLRIGVVDDSSLYRRIVADLLQAFPSFEVVGTASDGREAVQLVGAESPDLLILDLQMPVLDGLGVLGWLRDHGSPCGAIVLSSVATEAARPTVQALELGAFDFVLKPSGGGPNDSRKQLWDELYPRILAFRRSRKKSKPRPARPAPAATAPRPTRKLSADSGEPARTAQPHRGGAASSRRESRRAAGPIELVTVGVSTGGPEALKRFLSPLPASLPVPVVLVQHMPPGFTKSLAELLDGHCRIRVREAEAGWELEAGNIYIAPGGHHMEIVRSGKALRVGITDDPPENSCRPAVDYLFRSVGKCCGGRVIAAVLTGMGEDGVREARALEELGATVYAQDEASCVVFGMPRRLVEEGIADVVASPAELGRTLVATLQGQRRPVRG